jgi:hypothetical protein
MVRAKVLGRRKTPITSKVGLTRVCVLLVTETLNLGVELSKEDLQVATKLWDEVINPTCIEFEEWTGKPTQAMHEAITRVIARHANQGSSWNTWQRIWWKKVPKVHDKGLQSKSVTSP